MRGAPAPKKRKENEGREIRFKNFISDRDTRINMDLLRGRNSITPQDVSSIHTPITGNSGFLDRLLQQIFDKHARSTVIIDGVDVIRRLKIYVASAYLKPTTYLYTVLPQEESLKILTEFLLKHGYQ
ncbi:unnamed protein product [Adineta ricciae]|uniref:Uncharacterized protein n=1 Tax=Adineta ricciae TaxID=249248 RepID=A0A816BZU8_ADIRI|nr:unnamed protein product [Adineta ricciae]CAF1616511.1 unnamed protein product [Adineta ricciae]